MTKVDTIPETKVRLVAALAQAHPRTARRYLEGLPVRGHALRERLADAVRRAEVLGAEPRPPGKPSRGTAA